MESIEAIKERVKAIQDKQDKIYEEYREKWQNAYDRKEKAIKEADKAYSKAKPEEYHKQQEEVRLNTDALQMYGSKLSELDKEPWITKEEFEGFYNSICEYLQAIVEEDRKSLAELAKQMIEIRERESQEIKEGNELIEKLQKDFLKDPCGIFSKSGEFVPMPGRLKRFKDTKVLEFVNMICEYPLIKDLVPQEKKPKEKYWGRD